MKLIQQNEVAGASLSRAGRMIAGTLVVAFLSVASIQAQDPSPQLPGLDGPTIPGLTPPLGPINPDLSGVLGLGPQQPALPGFEQTLPVKKVNDAVAGWNSAEAGRAFHLGETIRRTWVMLDSEGKLRGQILGGDFDHSLTEVYFVREGRMIEKLSANSRGEFIVYGLEDGVYTLMVANEGRYAVNCLLVLDNNQMGGPPSSFDIPMSENSPRSVFEQVVSRATKVMFRNFGEFAFEQTKEDPARLYGLQGIAEHRPEAVDATTLGNHRVTLTPEGQLIGRLRAVDHLTGRPVDLLVTEVMLLANDATVATTQTNRYGIFSFDKVEAGTYTLLAAGKDGIAVTSFELTQGVPAPATDVQSVSFRRSNASNYLDVTLSPRRDIGWINAYFRDHVPPPRIPPVEDVPFNPFADYGNYGWGGYPYGAGMGYGMGMGMGMDACGCSLCAEAALSTGFGQGHRRGCLGRLKAKHGCGRQTCGESACDCGSCEHSSCGH